MNECRNSHHSPSGQIFLNLNSFRHFGADAMATFRSPGLKGKRQIPPSTQRSCSGIRRSPDRCAKIPLVNHHHLGEFPTGRSKLQSPSHFLSPRRSQVETSRDACKSWLVNRAPPRATYPPPPEIRVSFSALLRETNG